MRDPQAKKAKDKARQRKIASNSSDKASRKNAPRIKAMANRSVRRADKIKIAMSGDQLEENADSLRLDHRFKDRHWGTHNAAEQRDLRDKERSLLDATADHPVRGRQRIRYVEPPRVRYRKPSATE